MIKVGLTGGIGSGKSMVGNVFRHLGIPVFVADAEAKKLMHSNEEIRNKLMARYGPAIYDNSGQLRRSKLADIIFHAPEEREYVNKIVHPVVGEKFKAWANEKDAPFVVEEAAIIIESGAYKAMDALVVVTAPESLRISRVMQRDGVDEKDVKSRIRNQLPEHEKVAYADYIVKNDNLHLVLPQVITIFNALNEKV